MNLISALAALESNLKALTVFHVDEALAEQYVITPSTTWSTVLLVEQSRHFSNQRTSRSNPI